MGSAGALVGGEAADAAADALADAEADALADAEADALANAEADEPVGAGVDEMADDAGEVGEAADEVPYDVDVETPVRNSGAPMMTRATTDRGRLIPMTCSIGKPFSSPVGGGAIPLNMRAREADRHPSVPRLQSRQQCAPRPDDLTPLNLAAI